MKVKAKRVFNGKEFRGVILDTDLTRVETAHDIEGALFDQYKDGLISKFEYACGLKTLATEVSFTYHREIEQAGKQLNCE